MRDETENPAAPPSATQPDARPAAPTGAEDTQLDQVDGPERTAEFAVPPPPRPRAAQAPLAASDLTSAADVVAALAGEPRVDDLARLVHTMALSAADERRASLSDGLDEVLARLELTPGAAVTRLGDVPALLRRASEPGGALAPEGRALLSALLARGVSLNLPVTPDAELRVATAVLWLAAQTPVDAMPALDATLGTRAAPLWRTIARLVSDVDAGERVEGGLGRAAAIAGALGLAASASPVAREEASLVGARTRDPAIALVTRAAGAGGAGAIAADAGQATVVAGELAPRPRGPVAVALLALCGWLFVSRAARFLGELALAYKRPAELIATPAGLTLVSRTMLLGRTVRERKVHYPVGVLLRVTREIRYPRLGLYAGLVCLALGSYVGISVFLDGARSGSPELLGIGAIVLGVGLALDYALSHVRAGARGRCRVLVVPRKGPAIALGKLDPVAADAALARLGSAA